MIYTYAYLAEGQQWHTGEVDSDHTSAQALADAFTGIPLNQPTDEVRVWASSDPERVAVAYRPLSTEGMAR